MSDEIRTQLARRIYDGTLEPGTRLVELAIAQEFGTSQAPVREALRELEAMKLVVSERYKGSRVREITPREMKEAYIVRAVLEQRAAELAAPKFRNNVKELKDVVERICDEAKQGNIDGYAHYNLEFHRRIVQASENETLLECWEALRFEARIRVNLFRKKNAVVKRAAEHRPIVTALGRGDGERAGRLLREHSEAFAAAWEQQIDSNPSTNEQTSPLQPAES